MKFEQLALGQIRLIAMDVDGVLTDGSIIIGSNGFESKMFSARDGLGLNVLLKLGYEVAWVTGRSSDVVAQRAKELHIPHVMQGIVDKVEAIEALLAKVNLTWDNVLYIGDDLNDWGPFQKAVFTCTVSNGSTDMRERADYITEAVGGAGAVREIIELFLKHEQRWTEVIDLYSSLSHQRQLSKGEIQ